MSCMDWGPCNQFRWENPEAHFVTICANTQPGYVNFDDRELIFLATSTFKKYTMTNSINQIKLKQTSKWYLNPSKWLSPRFVIFIQNSLVWNSFSWNTLRFSRSAWNSSDFTNLSHWILCSKYFPFSRKDSSIHLHGLGVYVYHWQGNTNLNFRIV